jgi:predicted amidohydrolase
MSSSLAFSMIQPDIVWENKTANLKQYENYLAGIAGKKGVVVLPEMFSTGFCMSPQRLAETMDGPTVNWMKQMAAQYNCILTGSLIIETKNHFYNRLIWMQPNGQYACYDKRHLFAYAGEHEHYTAGNKRLIAQVNGWRICLQVCYDLRFPIWVRNRHEEYDVLLFVANWPQSRNLAWKSLLQARAIENMSYTIGVNRVGTDGNNLYYSGDSSVFDPMGNLLWQQAHQAVCHTITLQKETLHNARQQFPFLKDADDFLLR